MEFRGLLFGLFSDTAGTYIPRTGFYLYDLFMSRKHSRFEILYVKEVNVFFTVQTVARENKLLLLT